MDLLLISATAPETVITSNWLNTHTSGSNSLTAKLLITGIGQLQTTYALLEKIETERPGLVIQAGIGGSSYGEDIGKTFVVDSEELADLGLLEKAGFRTIYEMGLDQPDRFPFVHGKLPNPYQQLMQWMDLPTAAGITVNEIKSEDLKILQRNQGRIVESMEGAALHYVCLMKKIPFIQIRSISNVLGDRDKSRWKIKEALDHLNATLISRIQKLEQADETYFRI